jgi:hypothetical protein
VTPIFQRPRRLFIDRAQASAMRAPWRLRDNRQSILNVKVLNSR